MMRSEELMHGLLKYGRTAVQDLVVRSRNISDTMRYIEAERGFEMVKSISFVTTNLTTFEKKTFPSFNPRAPVDHFPLVEETDPGQPSCIVTYLIER